MIRYSKDPRWINARFNRDCECGEAIRRGDRIFYFPNGKTVLCETCGELASARFVSETHDEAVMSGQVLMEL